MARTFPRTACLAALAGTALLAAAAPASAYDYPTTERVNYVMNCMRDHPGPHYEMLNKCSCAIDALARRVKLDDFVAMSTATNATSIGGERGSYIRDTETLQVQIRKFRELQAGAKKGCFIALETPGR